MDCRGVAFPKDVFLVGVFPPVRSRYPHAPHMTPTTAILLSLLVPGSAHAMLGKPVRALAAFAVTVGMFLVGYLILEDRLMQVRLFQPFDAIAWMIRWVPLNLLPEAPNLGCTIVASLMHELPDAAGRAEAMRMFRLARPMEHFGFWLTGSSGLLACMFAADAHGLALSQRLREHNRAFIAGVSWFLPGSGHYLAGQKGKGLLMGGAVILVFVLGLVFSAGAGVDRGHHDAYWICQSFFGGGTLASALGLGQLEIPNPIPVRYSLGYTLTAVAGLMNIVVIIDAYSVVDQSEGVATA